MTKEEAIKLDEEYQEDCSPSKYEWAKNNIERIKAVLPEGHSYIKVFEIAMKGLKVATGTVFPPDMYTMDKINASSNLQDTIDTILGFEVHDDGEEFTLKLTGEQMDLLSMALTVFKHVGLAYHPNEFKYDIEKCIASLAKIGEVEDREDDPKRNII